MATIAALALDTWDLLYGQLGFERPIEDTVATAVTDQNDVEWQWDTYTMWKRDDYAEAQDSAGEIIVFQEDAASGADSTVRRGQQGTTAKVAGYSQGDVFYKNPIFPRHKVEKTINQVVRNDLWPKVWSWHDDTLSYTSGDTTYTLDQYIEDVEVVYQYNLNSDGKWYPFPKTWFDVERVHTDLATNNFMLRLKTVRDDSATVYHTDKRRPHPDDLTNLDARVAELVPWAAAAKLAAGRMTPSRNSAPSDRLDQQEGGLARDYRSLMGEFLRMRTQLNRDLRREVPADMKFRPRRGRKSW